MRARLTIVALSVATAMGVLASPAGAQQLIDAGKEGTGGGSAFVVFVVMVFVIGFALFFMDRIRRRATDD